MSFILPENLNTAVLFLVFNRLDTTTQVFNAIRKAKPPRIYIAADGPRESKDGEAEKTKSVRDYIIKNIDWSCEVKTLFRTENLGCKHAVNSAIKWFFESEEQGIILEDDILPTQEFFYVMELCLEKYKDNKEISSISGRNELSSLNVNNNTPFLTDKFWCWGWASWRDRVQDLNVELGYQENEKLNIKASSYFDYFYVNYMKTMLQSGKVSSWAFAYDLYFRVERMKSLVMPVNLVNNIGFGLDATHYQSLKDDSVQVGSISKDFYLPDQPTYDKNFVKKFMIRRMGGSRIKLYLLFLFNFNKKSKYFFDFLNNIRKSTLK